MHKIIPDTLFVGKRLIILPKCQSTNSHLRETLRQDTLPEGTVVLTFHQTSGRGQRGNHWEAVPGKNITLSLLLTPVFLAPYEQFKLNMAISVATYHFLKALLDDKLAIKWPNDIMYNNFKLGGILIENSLRGAQYEQAIVGIGLNINQTSFGYPQARSLALLNDQEYELETLIERLLESVEQFYIQLREGGFEEIENYYYQHLYRKDEWHHFLDSQGQAFEGCIRGVQPGGSLRVETKEGEQLFAFKEIRFV